MKRNFRIILSLLAALSLLPLASCREDGAPLAEVPAYPTMQVDWNSGVKTDYSYLTPYEPAERYTRLSEGALPELEPSGDYGVVLPYIGDALYAEYGYTVFCLYGLVTRGGMILTDPVFREVRQGYSYNINSFGLVPAYSLQKVTGDDKEVYAVCALDGSWVTPFDYESVTFSDDVVFLVRNSSANDIDVLDYSGRLLLNTKSLACYEDISYHSADEIANGYGEGLLALPLKAGMGTAYADVRTGETTYTDYDEGQPFSGGMAAVKVDGLFGYINRKFHLVIAPQFMLAHPFYDGTGVVAYSKDRFAVIDGGGSVLLEGNGAPIYRYDANKFTISENGVNYISQCYDSAFNPLAPDRYRIYTAYSGWLYYKTDSGVTVFNESGSYDLPGVDGVDSVAGNLAVVYSGYPNASDNKKGVMTLGGEMVLPLKENTGIILFVSASAGETYAVVSEYGGRLTTFQVLDESGRALFSGIGSASYQPECDLFRISSEQGFGYADRSGTYVFRKLLMNSVPD